MRRAVWFLFLFLFAVSPLSSSRSPTSGQPQGRPIARVWRGRTSSARAQEYQRYLFASGIARIRATPGNLGASVLRRGEGDLTEFLVISFWESLDAVKRFAGKEYENAVILPKDRENLVAVEPKVLHCEVVSRDGEPPPR